MSPANGAAMPPSGPADVARLRDELLGRLAVAGAPEVTVEVSWMARPVEGFRVRLLEGDRREDFGVPVRILAADRSGGTLERIVADALRRLRRPR